MTWPWEIVERDHEVQNPLSPDKIRLLGDYVRLTSESRVLDVACGKCGPALILASTYGCRILGIEKRTAFVDEAHSRISGAWLDARVEVRQADAAEVRFEPQAFDAALCLGASFIWGTIAETAVALLPAVRHGGFVAIGEPYWRRWPLPDGVDPLGYVDLEATVARLEQAGLALTGIIASSDDDWDHYESLHWRALEEWLADHPDDQVRTRHERFRSGYVRFERALLGWAVFVGRKS